MTRQVINISSQHGITVATALNAALEHCPENTAAIIRNAAGASLLALDVAMQAAEKAAADEAAKAAKA